MTELMKTIAVVYKRKGKNMLSEKEFINTLLFDLRWSNPNKSPKITAVDAQKILDAGKREGLLTLTEGALKPVFDYKSVEIPLNYLPSKEVMDEIGASITQAPPAASTAEVQKETSPKLAEPPKNDTIPIDVPLFTVLIEEIAQKTMTKKKDIVAQINRLQERLKVVPEVAALIIAREKGLDISKYYTITKEEIIKK